MLAEQERRSQGRLVPGFVSGSLIGALGGLIGLGGAEFRLPVLVGLFRLETLQAVILNKALSLVLVAAASLFRLKTIPAQTLLDNLGIVVNLLAGTLIGSWWAAGRAMTMSRLMLNRAVMTLLAGLAILLLLEASLGLGSQPHPPLAVGGWRVFLGVIAGLGIGAVAALLGVAGGELLIPTIVLLFGVDIKVAGSLSLIVSLPTMIVGFARYTRSDSFAVLKTERLLFASMAAGSIPGAAVGGLLLGTIDSRLLMLVLGAILLVSAVRLFRHPHP